jgi:hypothetical protein
VAVTTAAAGGRVCAKPLLDRGDDLVLMAATVASWLLGCPGSASFAVAAAAFDARGRSLNLPPPPPWPRDTLTLPLW